MKQIYTEKWSETVVASHSKYVFADKVKPGMILHVTNCFAYAPEREASDEAHIGVQNGATKVIVRARKEAAVGFGVSAYNDFYVGEGDRIYGYFPDADNTDTIEIHVIGVLMTVDDFRSMRE